MLPGRRRFARHPQERRLRDGVQAAEGRVRQSHLLRALGWGRDGRLLDGRDQGRHRLRASSRGARHFGVRLDVDAGLCRQKPQVIKLN